MTTATQRPKWDSGVAISKGKQSISLYKTYESMLSPRFTIEEMLQHEANIPVLEKRLSGKDVVFSAQLSSTAEQQKVVETINSRVVSLRKIVKGANPSAEIHASAGLGKKIVLTVIGVAGASDTLVAAYNGNTAWFNSVGIIAKDIQELTTLTNSLFKADSAQEQSMFARKAATMDKNTLQRAVEDMVTKISALGYHEFEITDPEAATLFAGLIPGSSGPAKKTPPVV